MTDITTEPVTPPVTEEPLTALLGGLGQYPYAYPLTLPVPETGPKEEEI